KRAASGSVLVVGRGLVRRPRMDERPKGETALRVDPVQLHGRGEREPAMLLGVVVRGDKAGQGDDDVESRERRHGGPAGRRKHGLAQAGTIRGSAAGSRRSASAPPSSRRMADDIVAPITT